MKVSRKIMGLCLAALVALPLLPAATVKAGAATTFSKSEFIETEQPELSEETKKLISLYQKTPTDANYLNLRAMVIQNYNAVLARKEAKLAELKAETSGKPGGEAKVAEMEEIVQEMYITYWNRINSSMLRFTDTRLLKWRVADAARYEYIPVMGASESIYVKRTPVTNKEYAAFVKATGKQAPSGWTNGTYPKGEDNYPVNFVSYADAQAYCDWLTKQDGVNTYRLPSESEWELAAGHMPKDADFNCGINDGRTPVEQYAGITRGAHGAIDFWGNVWEWTSSVRSSTNGITTLGVKGGSWASDRTECRTEHRKEGRNAAAGYEDVGFRVLQVLNGKEPEQKVELATLDAPMVSAVSAAPDSITLSWQPVKEAVEYQLFEYFEDTGLLQMLDTVKGTSVTISNLKPGSTHSYIVQPISYVEIADNVSPENSVKVTCGGSNSGSASVSENAYYTEAVAWATKNGILDSIGAAAFDPDSICNRAQLATFLWRASDAPAPIHTNHPFTDISPESYYYNAVLWVVEKGIASGTSATTFSPDSPVNRGQAVTFLYRTAGSPAVEGTVLFTDVARSAYYADAALWAAEQKIVAGTTATTFSPADSCTHGQIVTFLHRFCTSSPSAMKLYETNGLKCWLYAPSNGTQNMPLIVYLHGSTGQGDDPELLLQIEEFPAFLADGLLGEVPAYVLIPQLPSGQRGWESMIEPVISAIQEVAAKYPIDSGNISLTGFSKGGAGVWSIAASRPELFRCIAPCSGGLRPNAAALSTFSHMKIWAFVGTADTVVKPQPILEFMERLALRNSQASITQFDGAEHTDVPALVYLSDEIDLIHWLIEK